MNSETCRVSEPLVPHCSLIEGKHKQMLEELRFRHKLNFSEAIRQGIELVAARYMPEQSTGVQLQA